MRDDVHLTTATQKIIDFVVCEEIVFYEWDEVVAFCEEKLARGPLLTDEERAHLYAELVGTFAECVARKYCEQYAHGRSELEPPDNLFRD